MADPRRKPERKAEQPNEGEGSRSAARAYNKDQQEFVKEGRVGEAARAARKAVEEQDGDLEAAEREGKAHAAEHDSEEVRDYKKPE